MHSSRSPRAPRRALTLIELVIVLMIIATIAGFVIPRVGMLTRSSDMAATAKTQADLSNNIELYFSLQKRYPIGMDSLLVEPDATAVYTPANDDDGNQVSGLPGSNPHLHRDLRPGVLTNVDGGPQWIRSLTRSGFENVYDHSREVTNSNQSATTLRAFSSGDETIRVAEVIPRTEGGDSILLRLLPGASAAATPNDLIAPGTRLVAFGIGQNCDMMTKTLVNAPIYPQCDGTYYGRYVAIFRIYATGERATLVGVVDSYGRSQDYTQEQFNESLPDGARRG